MSAMLLTQQILNGLLDGVYYLLIALGLSLIFSLGGIVNLAHGAFYAIGAYLTLVLSPYLGFGGAFVAAPIAVALLGIVIEAHSVSPLLSCRSDPVAADDVRPCDGGRTGAADDLRRTAIVVFDSALAARTGRDRKLHLFLLPRGAARHCRDLHRRSLAAAAKDLVRPRGARRRAEPRHGRRARHFAAALYVGGRCARHRPCGAGRRACWRRSIRSTRRWARRSSRRPLSSW